MFCNFLSPLLFAAWGKYITLPPKQTTHSTFKMKKILFLVAASALMVACGQKGQTSDAAKGGDSAVAAADSLVFEGHLPGGDDTLYIILLFDQ